MALQVWLPLDGKLDNFGLSNCTITNTGATIDTVGKIGQCYAFNNVIGINIAYSIAANDIYTICCWANITGDLANRHNLFSSRSVFDYGDGNAVYIENSKLRFDASGSYDHDLGDFTVSQNTWFHVAVVRSAIKKQCYINGDLIWEKSISTNSRNVSDSFTLGNSNYPSKNNGLVGKLNDFRIDDHCLSAKEIKEIAQCCIGHWTLDVPRNWLVEPQASKYIEDALRFHDFAYVADLPTDTQTAWTFEAELKTISGAATGNIDVYFRNTSGAAAIDSQVETITSEWKIYKFHLNGAPNVLGLVRMRRNDDAPTNIYAIRNAKLYSEITYNQEQIIYDTSGLNHNLSVTGPLKVSNNTPRYKNCLEWTDTTAYLHNSSFITPADAITIAYWVRYSQSGGPTGDARNIPIDFYTSSGEMIHYLANNMNRWFLCTTHGRDQINTSGNYMDGLWHHHCMTYDGTTIKVYVDGVCKNTVSISGTIIPSTQMRIGSHSSPSSYRSGANCWQSDTRIYATALTADQVRELYETSMNIDNAGNVSARILS